MDNIKVYTLKKDKKEFIFEVNEIDDEVVVFVKRYFKT